MIESFNIPKNAVSKWAGITSAVFALSQAVTGILWGRASDQYGRKPLILLAMFCGMTTSLFFGFSRSLPWAIVARSLAGASNGNIGILRTIVAEMVPYKELQPTAFSIMPLIWTMGSIFGPAFGGALANPAKKYPMIFGNNEFLKKYPFALPNIVANVFFLFGIINGFLFLKETLETKKHKRDYGRVIGNIVSHPIIACTAKKPKTPWRQDGEQSQSLLQHSRISSTSTTGKDIDSQEDLKAVPLAPPSYREIFSRQSSLNILTYTLLAFHSMAYDQVLPIFMHYPRQMNRAENPNVRLPFKFTGGFGIDSGRIGLLFTAYGIVGMCIQFLIFPPFARRYGVLPCLKAVTAMFPFIYFITPFTALLPTPLAQQIGMLCIMLLKAWAAIFAFPCTTIMLTNSACSLRILGTLNGVSTSISALGRAAGPFTIGWLFSVGVNNGYMILPWWSLAAFSTLGAITPWWLVEMEGFGGRSFNDADNGLEGEEDGGEAGARDGRSHAAPTVGGSLANDEEDDDLLMVDDNSLPGSLELRKTLSHRDSGGPRSA